MKKFILLFLISFLFFYSTFAYDLTDKDKSSLDLINQKLEKIITQKWESYRSIFIDKLKNYSDKSTNEKLKSYIDYILKNIWKWKISEVTKKDLWNWFFLAQTENKTDLVYDWSIIKSFSHNWIPDLYEGFCSIINNNYIKNWEYKKFWYKLKLKEQKECIREHFNKLISKVEKTNNPMYFKLSYQWYESIGIDLIDLWNKEAYWLWWDNIKKVEHWTNWIYVFVTWERGWFWEILLIKWDHNNVLLFENWPDVWSEDPKYVSILDFELLKDQKIKVIYNWQNLKKMEKIIDLKNFK